MQPSTHLDINTSLCGRVTHLTNGYAEVLLHTTQQMVADAQGLGMKRHNVQAELIVEGK